MLLLGGDKTGNRWYHDNVPIADQIGDYLSFSRSNVSMGLKELQSWRLVKLLHRPGDRREYFEPPKDIWDIFKALLEERRRREIEPTLSMLRDALLENPSSASDKEAQKRMREMYDLIELSSSWFDDVQRLSPETLASLMKMGSKVGKLLDVRDKFRLSPTAKKTKLDKVTEQEKGKITPPDVHRKE
ncbi:ArsR family transcriptional regulator [Glaciimonas sp. Gout2]|uniref:ArsR family transcriptional regulator n=1 Tax=Glaciimonas sp. Gout2 TaxID=3048625 RepID=UPI002B226A0E|nr:ArsR family transcriptional regulator [Glaciimonas sp. Gout2]MEB0084937.1 ArsR family transcriptional regulator [Glaciimonas sp. Gout2]